MTLDITSLQSIVEVKLAPLFECGYCGCPIRQSVRLSYLPEMIGRYTPVYRCPKCRRYMGEPVKGEEYGENT